MLEKDKISGHPASTPLPRIYHPGYTLAVELAARNMSANALALKLRVPANRISDIVRGVRAITPETALRLGRYFGTGPEFWMNLQTNYDLEIASVQFGAAIEHDIILKE